MGGGGEAAVAAAAAEAVYFDAEEGEGGPGAEDPGSRGG